MKTLLSHILIVLILTSSFGCSSNKSLPKERSSNLSSQQQQELNSQLLDAARAEDNQKVIKLINAGADVEARYRSLSAETVLMVSVLSGKMNTVKTLIDAGADINAKCYDGTNALMMAAIRYNVDIVKVLLDAGANVNAKHSEGYTALMGAAFAGRLDNVKALLDAGADINSKDNKGTTALMVATIGRQRLFKTAEAVKLLLEKGADVTIKDKEGKTALEYAKENGDDEIINLLKQAGAKE
jgi:ankyrin repeat protein